MLHSPAELCLPSGVHKSGLFLGQFFKFDLQLLKCLILEINYFEELDEWQFNVLLDYLVCHSFERTMNRTLGLEDQRGRIGEIYVGFWHDADSTTNAMFRCNARIALDGKLSMIRS